MGKKNGKNGGADLSRLNPLDSKDKQILRVVIETPKGSRNKFALDPDEHLFKLKKVLPTGMAFPYDFGFAPSTEAEDGDPIDVLVLMDEPAFPGCVLTCRPIAIIVSPPFGFRSASISLPTSGPTMPYADFCPAVSMPLDILSHRTDTGP